MACRRFFPIPKESFPSFELEKRYFKCFFLVPQNLRKLKTWREFCPVKTGTPGWKKIATFSQPPNVGRVDLPNFWEGNAEDDIILEPGGHPFINGCFRWWTKSLRGKWLEIHHFHSFKTGFWEFQDLEMIQVMSVFPVAKQRGEILYFWCSLPWCWLVTTRIGDIFRQLGTSSKTFMAATIASWEGHTQENPTNHHLFSPITCSPAKTPTENIT